LHEKGFLDNLTVASSHIYPFVAPAAELLRLFVVMGMWFFICML